MSLWPLLDPGFRRGDEAEGFEDGSHRSDEASGYHSDGYSPPGATTVTG
jgi:hypothetical protein